MDASKKKYMSDINIEDFMEPYEPVQLRNNSMIFTGGRKKDSLNGLWRFTIDPYNTCIRQKWFLEKKYDANGFTIPVDYAFDDWDTITIPCSWNTVQKEFFLYESSMVFTRTFSYVPEREQEKVFLRIGAANYTCLVFLNKEYVGMHRGGSTPFFAEVSDKLLKDNRIIIVVDASRKPEQVPTENTDWFNYGGLYRDVDLIRVPSVFIRDLQVELKKDGTFENISIRVDLSERIDGTVHFSIPELGLDEDLPATDGIACTTIHAKPDLWSPDDPRLYDITCSFGDDMVCDRVGFREISVKGTHIYLNGKEIYLRGISCHEDSVENGKALTQEERIENIKIAKELGCNFMRLAHYPHHENMAQLADEMGLLLWEEIPVYWAIRFERKETYEDAENQLLELIRRDRNRASVIIWSVGNENADTNERYAFMSALADKAREVDPARLVAAACLVSVETNTISDRLADKLDIIGLNEYCGWYTPDFSMLPALMENSNPDRPVVVTEFGADAFPGHRGTITDKGTEDCQRYVYEEQIRTLRDISYIRGMTPWILYDFRCPRRTTAIQKYYNRKGLLSPDKTYRKPAFYTLQEFYRQKQAEEGT